MVTMLFVAVHALGQAPPPGLQQFAKAEYRAIQVAALRGTFGAGAITPAEAPSKVYLRVGEGDDPSAELLALLADLPFVVRKRSDCAKRKTVVGELCQLATGETEVWLGAITRIGTDVAELTVIVHTVSCHRRLRREAGTWRMLTPTEFAGLCRVA